jgi:hypothetical protein
MNRTINLLPAEPNSPGVSSSSRNNPFSAASCGPYRCNPPRLPCFRDHLDRARVTPNGREWEQKESHAGLLLSFGSSGWWKDLLCWFQYPSVLRMCKLQKKKIAGVQWFILIILFFFLPVLWNSIAKSVLHGEMWCGTHDYMIRFRWVISTHMLIVVVNILVLVICPLICSPTFQCHSSH